METENKIILTGIVLLLIVFVVTEYVVIPLRVIGFAMQRDFDGDGILDSEDKYPFDYDNDGMPDIWEKRNGLRYDANDANQDADGDGMKNIDEYREGTNPLVSDRAEGSVAQPRLPAPVEKSAKAWVWVIVILVPVLIVLLILYKNQVLRIITLLFHKRHSQEMTPRAYPPRVMPAMQRRPVLRGQVRVQRPLGSSWQKQYAPRVQNQQAPVQRQAYPRQMRQQTNQRSEQRTYAQPQKDVFDRLSNEVHSYKSSEDSLKRLESIK